MAYKNKTYVALDYDNDSEAYILMKAWKGNDNVDFDFYDAHDLTTIREDSNEETKKASLRERMKNSKVLVLLIGDNTHFCSTWVKWEIELAQKHGLPIIAVNLDNDREYNSELCPATLRDKLALHISFNPTIMAYALDNWPSIHESFVRDGDDSCKILRSSVYEELRI